jgi:hypothetical protein
MTQFFTIVGIASGISYLYYPKIRKQSLLMIIGILSYNISGKLCVLFLNKYPNYNNRNRLWLIRSIFQFISLMTIINGSTRLVKYHGEFNSFPNMILQKTFRFTEITIYTTLSFASAGILAIKFILPYFIDTIRENIFNKKKDSTLSIEEIDKIAPLKCAGLKNNHYNNNDYSIPDDCSVCLINFNINELSRTLPCNHTFHASCIDQWLSTSKSECPICRKELKIEKNI